MTDGMSFASSLKIIYQNQYDAGRRARFKDLPRSRNPFPPNSDQYEAWDLGWEEADGFKRRKR